MAKPCSLRRGYQTFTTHCMSPDDYQQTHLSCTVKNDGLTDAQLMKLQRKVEELTGLCHKEVAELTAGFVKRPRPKKKEA